MNLSDLKKGDLGIIKGYKYKYISLKILELGILPGVKFEVIFISVFYDPLCIIYDQYNCIALRRKEAKNILVKLLNDKK